MSKKLKDVQTLAANAHYSFRFALNLFFCFFFYLLCTIIKWVLKALLVVIGIWDFFLLFFVFFLSACYN